MGACTCAHVWPLSVPMSQASAEPNPPTSFYVSVAAQTDVGRVRKKNEDAFVVADLTGGALLDGATHARFDVGERGVLLAVSDGMGGARSGEVASALVVETLTRTMSTADPQTPQDALMNDAIQRAHRAVWDAGVSDQKKMGATLTAAYVRAGVAYIAEVGDSRAYLVRGGTLKMITHDQSLVQTLLDSGAIDQQQASVSPHRGIILQAMGHQKDVKVAMAKLELRDRDCLVICSDGLTGMVSDDEIQKIIVASGRPEIAAKQLVDLANERGGSDNITVVVAGIGGDLEQPGPTETVDQTLEILTTFELETGKKKA